MLKLKIITPQMSVTLLSTSVDLIANLTRSTNLFRQGKSVNGKALFYPKRIMEFVVYLIHRKEWQ